MSDKYEMNNKKLCAKCCSGYSSLQNTSRYKFQRSCLTTKNLVDNRTTFDKMMRQRFQNNNKARPIYT